MKKIELKKEWITKIKSLKKDYYIIDESLKDKKNQYISPYHFINKLFETANNDAIFIPDAGMNITWTYQANRLKKGQRLFTGLGASPMGYALPAAIGTYYATKSNQVVVIAGDGGFQMNIQELQAVSFHNIPLKIFIINNESLGNTKFPANKMGIVFQSWRSLLFPVLCSLDYHSTNYDKPAIVWYRSLVVGRVRHHRRSLEEQHRQPF